MGNNVCAWYKKLKMCEVEYAARERIQRILGKLNMKIFIKIFFVLPPLQKKRQMNYIN